MNQNVKRYTKTMSVFRYLCVFPKNFFFFMIRSKYLFESKNTHQNKI